MKIFLYLDVFKNIQHIVEMMEEYDNGETT